MGKNPFWSAALLLLIFVLIVLPVFFLTKPEKKEVMNTKAQSVSNHAQPIRAPSPTTIPTNVNIVWKNYASKEYGFSIQYPQDWQLLEEPNVFGIEIQKIDKQGLGFSTSIRVLENPNNLSLEQFVKAQVYPFNDGTLETPERIVVGALNGYKLNHLPQGLMVNLYLPYKKGVINIFSGGDIGLTNPKTKSFYSDILAQIIGSFRYQ